jgi:hypothetical protein
MKFCDVSAARNPTTPTQDDFHCEAVTAAPAEFLICSSPKKNRCADARRLSGRHQVREPRQ